MIWIGFPGGHRTCYWIKRKINMIKSIPNQDIKSYGLNIYKTVIESDVLYNHIAIVFLMVHKIFLNFFTLARIGCRLATNDANWVILISFKRGELYLLKEKKIG